MVVLRRGEKETFAFKAKTIRRTYGARNRRTVPRSNPLISHPLRNTSLMWINCRRPVLDRLGALRRGIRAKPEPHVQSALSSPLHRDSPTSMAVHGDRKMTTFGPPRGGGQHPTASVLGVLVTWGVRRRAGPRRDHPPPKEMSSILPQRCLVSLLTLWL